jgi:hypothetical protein
LHFLADENLDFAVVRILRTAGHDVRALAEEATRTVDAEVIALALREGRILLTEDKDFGWLAFVAGARSSASHGEALRGSFTVIQPGQTRITPGPHRGVRGE